MIGILFCLGFCAGLGVLYGFSAWQYSRTLYYAQTHRSFLSMRLNKGFYGEYLTWKYLEKLSGHKRYLFNCYLPKDKGETTEVDVILLHESGIYVFESKNYSGWIFGDEGQPYWTQTLPAGRGRSRKERFFNPILQNKVHLKWLSQYLDRPLDSFFSYIVFSDRCTLKKITLTSGQHHVVNRYKLLAAVKKNAKKVGRQLSDEEIEALYTTLEPLTQVTEAEKLAHIETVQAKQAAVKRSTKAKAAAKPEPPQSVPAEAATARPSAEPAPAPDNAASQAVAAAPATCPRCGGALILRTAAKGKNAGQKFWGCANFPKCRYMRPFRP